MSKRRNQSPSERKGETSDEPWKEVFASLWRWATHGWRKYLSIPLFLIVIGLPGLVTLIQSYQWMIGYVGQLLVRPAIVVSHEEWDVVGESEWVLLVGAADNKLEAQQVRESFLRAYAVLGEEALMNRVLVVRSPTQAGSWWVVVDVFPGVSNFKDTEEERRRLNALADSRGLTPLNESARQFFANAQVQQYKRCEFEKTYGKILRAQTPPP